MRVVLIAVLLSASLCAALPPRFRSTSHLTAGEDCTAAKGVCQVGACDGMQVKGQCPGDGVCCIPNNEVQKCLDVKGTCRDKSKPAQACPGDAWSPGKCPGKFVCCAPGAAQQQAPSAAAPQAPQAPQAPAADKKLLCMTFDDGPFDDVSFRLADAMYAAGVPSMFYVNCHKEMPEAKRTAWLAKLKEQGHSIGNHMCEHDIMAQGHYTKQYGAIMRKPDGCLTTPTQQAIFRTHVNDNYALWAKYGWNMKTARLNGDGRFNPCVVNALANPTIPDVTAHKHVAWNFEVGPTMVANTPGSFVMPHLKNPTGIKSSDGYFLNSDPAGNPYGIILAHDLHYAKGNKVQMLQDWVKAQSAKGYTWGKIDDNGKCVPK